MNTAINLSRTEKNKLAGNLEREKAKIVNEKVQKLQEERNLEKKQEIALELEQETKNSRAQLHRAYKNEPGLKRFIYNIKALLKRVSPEDLYHEHLLNELSGKIRRNSRGIVLASNNMISGRFISKLYSAYIQASELGDALRAMFKRPESLELYTKYAFKYLHKNVALKRELSELVDVSVLRANIQGGGEVLREYLSEQRALIKNYSKNIDPEFAASLLRGLSDLHCLFLFVTFDYKRFFIAMGGSIAALNSGNFSDCPISMRLKPQLENFYHFVALLSMLDTNEVARDVLACGYLLSKNDDAQVIEDIKRIVTRDEGGLQKKLKEFCKIWNNNICKYPFVDLIRLCNRNRFYEPRQIKIPSLRLKERVKKFIEQQLLFELQLFVEQVKEEFNVAAKKKLLLDYDNSLLSYYHRDSEVNTGRFYGIPGFGYVEAINTIYNFLTKYYAKNIKKVIIYLIRTALPKSASLRTTLLNQSMRLDNLEERIRNFNDDLGPEKTRGKNLINIVYRLEKNDTGNLVKQIKDLIEEIDSEAEHLLAQAHNIFAAAVEKLQEVFGNENPKLQEALGTKLADSQISLQAGIEDSVQAFKSIQTLLLSYRH